jgi:hypothetical protein
MRIWDGFNSNLLRSKTLEEGLFTLLSISASLPKFTMSAPRYETVVRVMISFATFMIYGRTRLILLVPHPFSPSPSVSRHIMCRTRSF